MYFHTFHICVITMINYKMILFFHERGLVSCRYLCLFFTSQTLLADRGCTCGTNLNNFLIFVHDNCTIKSYTIPTFGVDVSGV